jgi:TonB family protein
MIDPSSRHEFLILNMLATRTTGRLFSLLPIGVLHVFALLAFNQSVSNTQPGDDPSGVMRVFFIQTTSQTEEIETEARKLTRLTVLTDHPLDVNAIGTSVLDFPTARNAGTTISAPTLKGGNPIDMAPFITQAALLSGEGATVVLRVEILASGEPGRMSIEVSSGSRQVDQAAQDYARQLRWFAGRINENAEAMWIRWSVRLQA